MDLTLLDSPRSGPVRVDFHAIDHVGRCFKLFVGAALDPLSQTHASLPSEACNAHLPLMGIGNLDLASDAVPLSRLISGQRLPLF
ncbi:hypothetical protein N7510_007462 [Penicillium lagena]|uniref:uncharacterized protein n=1 Tax=Penicillium lagena TaxID=94218 RepID=UPI0025414D81|nr:uncharacterized protein N7510_007462 [Penicillium lagena]KAJ5610743.1 hypothetical protein N7510_007462 [Penicillium lagena]